MRSFPFKSWSACQRLSDTLNNQYQINAFNDSIGLMYAQEHRNKFLGLVFLVICFLTKVSITTNRLKANVVYWVISFVGSPCCNQGTPGWNIDQSFVWDPCTETTNPSKGLNRFSEGEQRIFEETKENTFMAYQMLLHHQRNFKEFLFIMTIVLNCCKGSSGRSIKFTEKS